MFDQLKMYQAALWLMPGIGDILSKQLIAYCGSVEGVFQANYKKLVQIPGIGDKTARDILSGKGLEEAEKFLLSCKGEGVRPIHFTDIEYPFRLRQSLDSPAFLFISGKVNLENSKVVAIVGTRRASEYGKIIVEEIIKGLIPHDPLIVSGLAYGIDIHAHKKALEHNLSTVAVIAGGIRHLYPSVHLDIARRMMKNGGIVAEFAPDTMPEAHHFPDRNRIIAGLSDIIIVVETAKTGGAMITAEFANSYNREVMAIPGNVHRKNSEGCNALIRNHKAHIYTSVKDIEYIMNWDPVPPNSKILIKMEDFTGDEKSIIEAFRNNKNELLIDELSWKSQIPVNKLAGYLLNLELKGYIKSLPGKKYRMLI